MLMTDRGRAGVGRVADRVDEGLVGVGAEVHDLRCPGCHRPGHLDVQQHLTVGAGGVRAGVLDPPSTLAAVTEGTDRPRPEKYVCRSLVAEPAAELQDRDRLPGAVGARRELVGLGDLGRGVGGLLGGGRGRPDLRPDLRPVVQAEDRDHDAVERGGHLQRALPVPVLDLTGHPGLGTAGLAQVRAEHLGQGRRAARDLDPARGFVGGGDLQTETAERLAHQLDVGRFGAVGVGQLALGDGLRREHQLVRQLRAPPEHHGHLDPLLLVHRPEVLDAGNCRAFAARERHERP